ncbi:MAG TPA: polymer-forming cytoskeletal protein [Bryobacteraceae bacterium]|nr:polymer-forming cytoskeletal protein [Bryobacteraceae bacterium]
MWNKTREGQVHPSAPAPPAAAPDSAAFTAGQPGIAQRTVFGKSMKIIGEVTSEEELQLEGDLEGKLTLKNRLTIGPSSKVKANIKAKEVVISGSVHGNVESESRITLRTGANLVGDIKTAGIVIEDGAYFKGGIDISRPEPAKAAPQTSGASAGGKH